ncbi:MAG TPA: hypothetical protein VEP49_03780 [Acidimicrobiia bacterium]|nr:hypothetical protein [Acidimicrobiia bacterium]
MADGAIVGRRPAAPVATENVEGNARLTGVSGAALFGLLAVEGVTILRIHDLLSVHVFVGMVIAAFAVTKLASVGYRFARYYLGDPAYVRKGPPPMILRIVGPLVVVTTIAVVGTGIVALAVGRSARWLVDLHKVSFICWFAVTTVHVIGHVLDTPRLAVADWRGSEGVPVPGAALRRLTLVVTLLTGLVLGYAVLHSGWLDTWHRVRG